MREQRPIIYQQCLNCGHIEEVNNARAGCKKCGNLGDFHMWLVRGGEPQYLTGTRVEPHTGAKGASRSDSNT